MAVIHCLRIHSKLALASALIILLTPGALRAQTPPDPVPYLGAMVNGTNVNLFWDLNWGGTIGDEARVYRSQTSGGPYTLVGTTDPTLCIYTDAGLAGGTYYYIVRIASGSLESVNSNEVSATIDAGVVAPSALTATAGSTVVNLQWQASTSTGVTEYRILRSTSTGGPYTQVGAATSTSYQDTGLTNGITYYYVVRAWNGTQESGNSNEASATPSTAPPDTLQPPQSLSATGGDGSIHLQWGASPSAGVMEYRVLRSDMPGGPYTQIGTTSTEQMSYDDLGLTNGTTYYYVVRAWNGTQESGNSNEVSATPASLPAAPTNLTAAAGDSVVDLQWQPSTSEGITEYRVLRSETPGGPYTQVGTVAAPGTTFHDSGLWNYYTYYYVVCAWNGTMQSGYSNEVAVSPTSPPESPWNLAATAGDTVVNINWQIPDSWWMMGMTEVRILRSQSTGGPYTQIGTASPWDGYYHDTGLTNGTTYYYVARAWNGNQESANSNEASATPSTAPPDTLQPPQSLSATGGDGSIHLQWGASPSAGVTEYRVLRSDMPGGPYTQIGTTSTEQMSYDDLGLTNGTTYYYVVRAWNGTQESGNSNEANATPNAAPPDALQPPYSLTATSGNTTVDLQWQASFSAGITEYHIQRATTAGGPYEQVGTVTVPGTTYHDTGLTNGTTYYYVVHATNGTQESTNSNEAQATPYMPPDAPQNLTATAGAGVIGLNWIGSADRTYPVTGYQVYRSTTSGGEGETLLTTTASGTTNYNDIDVTTGVTYYYRVRAVDSHNNQSEPSNEAEAAASAPLTVYTEAEETVDSGRPDFRFGWAYGSKQNDFMGGLFVGYGHDPAGIGRSYLRFNFASLPQGINVVAGTLCCYLNRIDTNFSDIDTPIGAYFCADDSWAKDLITWNTAPMMASSASAIVQPTGGDYYPVFQPKTWLRWNLREDVQREYTGDKLLTLVLRAEDEKVKNWKYFTETAFSNVYRPYLEVRYLP